VPLFALANGGIPLGADAIADASTSTVALGAAIGLVVGKSVGILGASLLAARFRIAELPEGTTNRHLLGVSMLGGIGFTVSIFVATLAFDDAALVDEAKIGILGASVIASVFAALLLRPGANAVTAERVPLPE
jgi:NhaA family Na+:H+ antiporter